jgi:hypothetical protein
LLHRHPHRLLHRHRHRLPQSTPPKKLLTRQSLQPKMPLLLQVLPQPP